MMQLQGGDNNNVVAKVPQRIKTKTGVSARLSQPRNQPRVHGGHYEPDEWNQLSYEEKAEVQRLQQVKKQQRTPGRAIGEVNPQLIHPPTPTFHKLNYHLLRIGPHLLVT
jgi:hypothetical protein